MQNEEVKSLLTIIGKLSKDNQLKIMLAVAYADPTIVNTDAFGEWVSAGDIIKLMQN